jgi:hypothetical protein
LGIPSSLKRSIHNNPLNQSHEVGNGNFKLPPMGSGQASGAESIKKMSRNNSNSMTYNNTIIATNEKGADELTHVDKNLNNLLADTLKNRKS